MAEPDKPDERLTQEELSRQDGEPLPPREAMSTLDVQIAPEPPIGADGEFLPPA
jgi:hypothetical protein